MVSKWFAAPYLHLPVPSKMLQLFARFRLACHYLAVETGRWRGVNIDDRKCPLCQCGAVQDEHHHVFVCPFFAEVRLQYPDLFVHNMFSNIQSLFKIHSNSGVARWQLIVRQTCSYLEATGGIFRAIQPAD